LLPSLQALQFQSIILILYNLDDYSILCHLNNTDPVAGCCENGNEPSSCTKGGEFIDQLIASQEGLCSMELAS
jgi:hypothetical protein